MKKRNIVVMILLVLGLLSITVGASVAFFNYTRLGSPNIFAVGRIFFTSSQNGTINLTNAFPISSEEALTDTENTGSVSITVKGDTDYDDGVEYLISTSDVNIETVSGKKVPISLDITVNGNGLGTEDGDYYDNRNSYTTSKYKIEYDGNMKENAHILVGFIGTNTTLGTVEGIEETINIKAYIDADRILISDTYDGTESSEMGTPNSLAHNKTVFTTEEWNSFSTTPLSFKITVEANEGIWVKGQTDYECFDIEDNGDDTLSLIKFNRENYIFTVNNNMTEEEITECAQFMENLLSNQGGGQDGGAVSTPSNLPSPKIKLLDTEDDYEAFCRGTGKLNFSSNSGGGGPSPTKSLTIQNNKVRFLGDTDEGMTFQEALDNHKFEDITLTEMVNYNFIIGTNTIPESCNTDEVIIPNKINGKMISVIGNSAFSYKDLTSITIPDSVTTIGEAAFSGNQLTSVTIPNNVTTIENYAFESNKLTSVTIPNSVTSIGASAFSNNQLTSVTIPDSVVEIGYNAFSNNQLTSVTIPDSVTTIDDGAFENNKLTSVTIPSSVTTIKSSTFKNNQLTSATIPNNVTTIENYSFANNKLANITIPNSVTTIGRYAFSNNQLTNLTIPYSVTTIDDGAFENNKLTSVTIPNSVTTIGQFAFSHNQLTNVTIPNSVTTISNRTFSGNQITDLNINMSNIPASFCSDQQISTLTNLNLGNNVINVGNGAFQNNQITSLTIPSSVTTIGSYAFNANQLTSVTIGNGITEIGEYAFYKNMASNTNLASITIDKSCSVIKSMSQYAWIGTGYRTGTTIYGSNNVVCDSW